MNVNFKILIKLFFLAVLLFTANLTSANETQEFDAQVKKLKSLLSSDLAAADKLIKTLDSKVDNLNEEQKGRLLVWKAVYNIYLSNYDEASQLLFSAEKLVSSIQNLSLVYRFQMTNYLGMSDYKSALKAAKNQIKVIDHLVDPENQRDAYVRIANFYYNIGSYKASERYVQKAIKLIDKPITAEHCFLKSLSASNSTKINRFNKAKSLAHSAISLCEKVNYKLGVAVGQRVLGDYFFKSDLLSDAESAYKAALKLNKEINFESEMKNVEALLSEVYFNKNKYLEARQLANRVIKSVDDSYIYKAKSKSYRILADIYSQEGNYKQAFEASIQAQKYQQLIYDDEKIKTLAYEAAKFDVEELEDFIQKNENTAYISSGREQNQIDKEMDLIYNNTILQYLLLLLGTTVFTSTYVGVSSYRRNRYNKLTGLMRHDAAMRKSRDFFHDAMYRKNGFAVISLDVDQLKAINRTLGHERADWVLTVIADAIKKFTRFKKAYGCYSGGGSFYIYMELKHGQEASELAKQLVEQFESCNTVESLKLFKMTVSVGVASIVERVQDINEKEICRRADVALQVAKEYSGNEIVNYQASFDEADNEYKKQMRFVQFIDPKLMVRARTL